jgi:hypothetical protein
MHFWRQEYFKTLKEVGTEVRAEPQWTDYAAFCELFEHGLRKEAFTHLDRFISSLELSGFADRRRFVRWILERTDGRAGRHMLIPHPLQLRVVEPTLLEWTLVEPECYEPHLWLGGNEHLRRAIELAPDNELAAKKLIVLVLSGVGHSTHELPNGYLGTPEEDLAALGEAKHLVQKLSNDDERARLAADIAEERKLIQEYLRNR